MPVFILVHTNGVSFDTFRFILKSHPEIHQHFKNGPSNTRDVTREILIDTCSAAGD